jgi:DNA polymerase sigma
MKARRSWTDAIQTLREHKRQPRLLYPIKLSITIDGKTKLLHNKTKLTHYLSTNPALQRIITEKKITMQGQKPRPRKSKKVILQQTYKKTATRTEGQL